MNRMDLYRLRGSNLLWSFGNSRPVQYFIEQSLLILTQIDAGIML